MWTDSRTRNASLSCWVERVLTVYCVARAGSQLYSIVGPARLPGYVAARAVLHPVATVDAGPESIHSTRGE